MFSNNGSVGRAISNYIGRICTYFKDSCTTVFSNNTADRGRAIYGRNNSTVSFEDNSTRAFSNNNAGYRGGATDEVGHVLSTFISLIKIVLHVLINQTNMHPLCYWVFCGTCFWECSTYIVFLLPQLCLCPYYALECTSRDTMSVYSSLKWATLSNSSYFNGDSCYKYNLTRIDYIKLSASVYGNVGKPLYNK